jgi:hypothetical protein
MKGRLGISQKWWDSLSLKEKQSFKKQYETIRLKNESRRFPFPHMVHTEHTRISKLTGNQIHCIWRFREDNYNLA